ncbi:uncharacterized protein LOC125232998 [Leguminivora glycinivorella]|uniref:uncharacterized protein LOC125232998 n=1 Tax=Leguminivora glycinivorella TaxID=1035111 RepID=UPI00200F4915|nr:uncharacterized protein LOC125232998 [Leguminivora glycinivorella]XP_047994820.1 uncharacterized protein LOC125232998 [Leguminivora glycinivorella]
MATCGVPSCRSTVSDKSQGDTPFKGPCGLPDCRNEASASTSRTRQSGMREQYCGLPGCMDPTDGKEVCLYRARDTSVFGRLTDAYKLFWSTWKKIESDPFYWSLFKSSMYFLLGLKLFSDLAAEFRPIPKCARGR